SRCARTHHGPPRESAAVPPDRGDRVRPPGTTHAGNPGQPARPLRRCTAPPPRGPATAVPARGAVDHPPSRGKMDWWVLRRVSPTSTHDRTAPTPPTTTRRK